MKGVTIIIIIIIPILPMINMRQRSSDFSRSHSHLSDRVRFLFLFFLKLFLAVLGLHCYTWALSSCGEQGLLFVAGRKLLVVVASLVAEHGL